MDNQEHVRYWLEHKQGKPLFFIEDRPVVMMAGLFRYYLLPTLVIELVAYIWDRVT